MIMWSNYFDTIANDYDKIFSATSIGCYQRSRIHQFLRPFLSASSMNILELNCGTGIDALNFAAMAHNVTATDNSPAMIKVLEDKLANSKVLGHITPMLCSIQNIETLLPTKYDLVFSNFAGMNYLPKYQLQQCFADVARLLKPAGVFIPTLFGTQCLLEKLYFICTRQYQHLHRRAQSSLAFNAEETIYYYSLETLKKISTENFNLQKSCAIGLTVPPSYLQPFCDRFPLVEKIGQSLDKFTYRFVPPDWGDHYVAAFVKK